MNAQLTQGHHPTTPDAWTAPTGPEGERLQRRIRFSGLIFLALFASVVLIFALGRDDKFLAIGLAAVGLFFINGGIFALLNFAGIRQRLDQVARFPRVPGQVTALAISPLLPPHQRSWGIGVKCRYEFASESYEELVHIAASTFSKREEAEKYLLPRVKDATCQLAIDPERPTQPYLHPVKDFEKVFNILPIAFFAMGTLILFFSFREATTIKRANVYHVPAAAPAVER